MTQAFTIHKKIYFGRGRGTRKVLCVGEAPQPKELPEGNVPRIARLMALAIRFNGLITSGEITDQADLARLGQVSRARMTQIMNLLQLAPDIQEEVLYLPRTTNGRDSINERMVRPIVTVLGWGKQRRLWAKLNT